MCDDGDVFLNDVWTMYFHDPNDLNWTNSSYINLGNISTVDDFWNHHSQLKDNIHKGMFFLMREHVFPCWDDPCNIKGGCFSLKVLKDDMPAFWEDLCIKLLGETILKDDKQDFWDIVNGVSTSPKKHFCIIKIWLKNLELNNKTFFDIIPSYYGDMLWKSNIENINNDVNKQ
jgi:hypothetical protein